MIAPIPFDPHRFRDAAPHYLAGRPSYAPGLAPLVAGICKLDGSGRMLDLGCGPGQLALAFAPFVGPVLAMDPEPGMLALARDLCAGLPIAFEQGSSADLANDMGPFRIVTIGRAFHWMDRVETARRLDGILEPGGALVLFRTDHLDVPDNGWQADYRAVLDAHVTGARAAWKQPGWVSHDAVLLASPFPDLTRIGLVTRQRTPVAAILQRALSMSSTAKARLGEAGLAQLARDIGEVLQRWAMDGMVTEVFESVALIARRA